MWQQSFQVKGDDSPKEKKCFNTKFSIIIVGNFNRILSEIHQLWVGVYFLPLQITLAIFLFCQWEVSSGVLDTSDDLGLSDEEAVYF